MNIPPASNSRAYVALALLLSLLVACSSTSATATQPNFVPIWMYLKADAGAWIDENDNGMWDTDEQPLENVRFRLEVEVTYPGKEPLTTSPLVGMTNQEGEAGIFYDLFSTVACEGEPGPKADVVVYAELPRGFQGTTPEGLYADVSDKGKTYLFGFNYIKTPTPEPAPTPSP